MTATTRWEGRNAALDAAEFDVAEPPPLAALAPAVERHAIPHVRRDVAIGSRLARGGELLDRVFLPLDAIILIARQTPLDPVPLSVGLIGREGLVGCGALLRAPTWSHDAIVIAGGTVAEIARADLETACAAQPTLHDLLLRVTYNHMLQLAQSVVANLGHSLERRLARWLTMFHDRIDGNVVAITHDLLAQVLNVRRASVTDALHVLEGERLVRSLRGRIQIRDRVGLQARCWQSYGLSENDHRALLVPPARPPREPQPDGDD